MKKVWYYETRELGKIGIAEEAGAITNLFFETEQPPQAEPEETELIQRAYIQLREYLDGKRREFQLPLKPEGTPFQIKDWNELCKIPYGETRSYGEIAAALGKPKGARAVGHANHRNPISVIIPCHRVIGSDGTLVGYGGGMDKKEFLLKLEGIL